MDVRPIAWAAMSLVIENPKLIRNQRIKEVQFGLFRLNNFLLTHYSEGFDIPKIYLTGASNSAYEYEVVDGQQRIRAIWEYHRDEYALSSEAEPIGRWDIAGKTFDELPDDLKDIFHEYNLNIVIFEHTTEDEIEEMFIRLQNGMSLNSAEKRNAISGAMRNFVHENAEEHPFFTESLGFANKRFSYDELLAQMTLTELHGRSTTVKHEQLKDMYEKNRGFETLDGKKAKKVTRVLDFLRRAFPKRTPELTKANALSMYILASSVLDKICNCWAG